MSLLTKNFQKELKEESLVQENAKQISHQFLTIFGFLYLPLCRKFQIVYRLEPAGSHGVFSLGKLLSIDLILIWFRSDLNSHFKIFLFFLIDDFQYLPFLFGSAELIDHPMLHPRNFTEENIARANSDQYMFYGAIDFIFKVKNGPFFEHSNQLWNISGVDEWSKINGGLYKKYCNEVLHKFPIIQHIVFSDKVLKWQWFRSKHLFKRSEEK